MKHANTYTIKELLKKYKINFEYNANLSRYTPFKYPILSKLIIHPNTKEELINIVSVIKKYTTDQIYFFGNFTNSIIHEKSKILKQIIIMTRNLKKIEINEVEKICEVECGYPLPKLSSILTNRSYEGFSGLLGIPGSIGGAVYMNAGSFGHEISDKLISVDYLDKNLNIKTILKNKINFSWRYSGFQDSIDHLTILSAKFKLDTADLEKQKRHLIHSKKRRSRTQEKPGNNFGSVFATKWIYNESSIENFWYKNINNLINYVFKITKFSRPRILSFCLTKLLMSLNKKYFNLKNNEKIRISNKTLNCFLIKNEKTKPSDYINFINDFKKKFKPNCKVEIQIYE